jgi:hypothetical protein
METSKIQPSLPLPYPFHSSFLPLLHSSFPFLPTSHIPHPLVSHEIFCPSLAYHNSPSFYPSPSFHPSLSHGPTLPSRTASHYQTSPLPSPASHFLPTPHLPHTLSSHLSFLLPPIPRISPSSTHLPPHASHPLFSPPLLPKC